MTQVLFFGGYASTQQDMGRWTASAKSQRSDIEWSGIQYPRYASADKPMENYWMVPRYAAMLKPGDWVVGHSSGCAYANAVVEAVKFDDGINLVCLDGFRPSPLLLQRSTTHCWSAACDDTQDKITRHFESINFDALSGTPNFHIYVAERCTLRWALHFSLVNRAANDENVGGYISRGYTDCVANLCWLPPMI
jgi:hypothetical protein